MWLYCIGACIVRLNLYYIIMCNILVCMQLYLCGPTRPVCYCTCGFFFVFFFALAVVVPVYLY